MSPAKVKHLIKANNQLSPLRYPGGKSLISGFISQLFLQNELRDIHFYELYAGGAGASINLLLNNCIERLTINDADYSIYVFWHTVINNPEYIIKKIHNVTLNVNVWNRQNQIISNWENELPEDVAFATFFLNRTNRSGIIKKAGPIGGFDQSGPYKMDARFNKKALINRIKRIAEYGSRITIRNEDALDLINESIDDGQENSSKFFFLDPPYYDQGENLYMNFYSEIDHSNLRDKLVQMHNLNWILTYDLSNTLLSLYENFQIYRFGLNYSLQKYVKAKEMMIISPNLVMPSNCVVSQENFVLITKEIMNARN